MFWILERMARPLPSLVPFKSQATTISRIWGHISHNFPSVEDVRGAAEDHYCKNMVVRFLKKFWMEGGGRALAFGMAVVGTQEVLGFLFCCFFLFWSFWFSFAYIFRFLSAELAMGSFANRD